jgi:hypothetical protein
MSSFRKNRVFDPFDLDIIERVYQAAWARVEADKFRDTSKDDERKTALRQWVFFLAGSRPVYFDTLSEKVATIIPKPWITPPIPRGSPPHVRGRDRKGKGSQRPAMTTQICRYARSLSG